MIPGDPIQSFIATLEQQQIYGVEAGSEVVDHYRKVFGLEGNLFQQYLNYMYQLIVTRDLGPGADQLPDAGPGRSSCARCPGRSACSASRPCSPGCSGAGRRAGRLAAQLAGLAVADQRRIALSHVPSYFVALMLVFIFAYRLAWFPPTAAYDPALRARASTSTSSSA